MAVYLKKLPFDEVDLFNGRSPQWTFFAIAEHDGACQVEDFLCGLTGRLEGTADDMLAFIEQMIFDSQGPQRWLNTKKSHESVANERIFEFIVGDLRVHWFYGSGRKVVILAVAALKQGQKTPKPLAKELLRLRFDYEEAVKSGSLQILPGDKT